MNDVEGIGDRELPGGGVRPDPEAMVLKTARLRLQVPTTEEMLEEVDRMPEEIRKEVSDAWLTRLRNSAGRDPWVHGFVIRSAETGARVGSCGFKGPPDAEGVVELAYGIEPGHENRGYATEAAGALADFARASGRVRLIRAHTKAPTGPSSRVLTKCGFRCLGEVVDPEDGPVQRWELAADERPQ